MTRTFLLLITLLFTTLSTFAQWYWHNPSPDGIELNDIFFVSPTNGWAAGVQGKILHYDGVQWQKEESNTPSNLNGVWFLNDNLGWAVGDAGTILKYENGNWIWQYTGYWGQLAKVSFTSPSNGWAVGDHILHYDGTSWSIFSSPALHPLTDVFFVDENHGWAAGSSTIMKFNGTAWLIEDLPAGLFGFTEPTLYFTDALHGWMGGSTGADGDGIILEYDGTNWSYPSSYLPLVTPAALYFDQPDHGWVCGRGSYMNVDGQSAWEYHSPVWTQSLHPNNIMVAMAGLNASDLYAVAGNGNIFYHDTAGWRLSNSMSEGNIRISFPDTAHGWFIGGEDKIYAYKNGTWGTDTIFPGKYMEYIHFCDSSNGIASAYVSSTARYAIFRYTVDHWQLLTDTISIWISSVYSTPAGNLYATGSHSGNVPRVFKFNGGSVSVTEFPEFTSLKSICFPDTSHGWMIGGSPQSVLAYANGQWNVQFSPSSSLKALSFANYQSGWLVGSSEGKAWHWDGQQWVSQPPIPSMMTSGIHHPTPDQVYAFVVNCIFTLENNTWITDTLPSSAGIESISYPAEEVCWAGLKGGGILSNQESPFPVGIPLNTNDIRELSLFLYPNPVSGQATIQYTIPMDATVRINIYDFMGREIQKVVDTKLPAGKYQIAYQTMDMPKGIYFLRLTANNQLASMKIIIR